MYFFYFENFVSIISFISFLKLIFILEYSNSIITLNFAISLRIDSSFILTNDGFNDGYFGDAFIDLWIELLYSFTTLGSNLIHFCDLLMVKYIHNLLVKVLLNLSITGFFEGLNT